MRLVVVVATTTLAASSLAVAQEPFRCDCTTITDTCGAEVVARGSFLEIKTNAPQCARVDYFVDGQPFVSVVVDGEDRENWLARTTNPRILVQSCQVCRDTTAATPARTAPSAAPATEAGASADLQPLIAPVPEYPAAANGARGFVEVEFTVTPAGAVTAQRVTAAEPRNVFDAAALAAIARRRYSENTTREPQVRKERMEFAPPNAATMRAARSASGPRNQCVREDAVYNYGEMVDVGLVNACTEPLHLFGCGQGTGRDLGRWVCSTSEERGEVLVQGDDQRIGRRFAPTDPRDFRAYTYTGGFSLTRAPNSQLWWVACAESDAACRSDARLWTRAVAGQSASIDPKGRASIALASSD